MTTFAEAEAARIEAITALRDAGLRVEAANLAALSPITDAATARAAVAWYRPAYVEAVHDAAYDALAAVSDAWNAADAAREAAKEADR